MRPLAQVPRAGAPAPRSTRPVHSRGTSSFPPAVRRLHAALEGEADGYFSGLVQTAHDGTLYRFKLDADDYLYPDPASRWQPEVTAHTITRGTAGMVGTEFVETLTGRRGSAEMRGAFASVARSWFRSSPACAYSATTSSWLIEFSSCFS